MSFNDYLRIYYQYMDTLWEAVSERIENVSTMTDKLNSETGV